MDGVRADRSAPSRAADAPPPTCRSLRPASRTVRAVLAAVAVLVLGGARLAAAEPAVAPAGGCAADDGTAVVCLREVIAEIEDSDPGPTLTIYADGRARVHFPRYMRRAGDWTLRLAPGELDALVSDLSARGLLDFDAGAVRASTEAADAARAATLGRAGTPGAAVFAVTDQSVTVLDLRLDRYAASGRAAPAAGARQIAWEGLAWDARRYPGVPSLQGLAATHRDLRAIMERVGGASPP